MNQCRRLERKPKIASGRVQEEGGDMKFLVTIDRDEDGVFVVECPAIPGCISQGETEGRALDNIGEAIRDCLAVRSERGMPLTVTTREVEIAI